MSMRFHDDLWAQVRSEARRLEVPYSEYIRGAIVFYVAYQAGMVAGGEVVGLVEQLGVRVSRLETHLRFGVSGA